MPTYIPAHSTLRAAVDFPLTTYEAVADLALAEGRTTSDVLLDGAILVPRLHGRGQGLPAPRPPLTAGDHAPSDAEPSPR
jgi:hypothetical protein